MSIESAADFQKAKDTLASLKIERAKIEERRQALARELQQRDNECMEKLGVHLSELPELMKRLEGQETQQASLVARMLEEVETAISKLR